MTHSHRVVLFAALATAAPAAAQQPSARPVPRILEIHQEVVKPGKEAAHERHEQGWPTAFASAGTDAYYTALTSMTGSGDAWYVSAYASFADMAARGEQIAKAGGLQGRLEALADKDADFITARRIIIAHLLDSLAVGTQPDYGKVHGWRINTVRVRFGRTDDFEEMRRRVRAAFDKAGIDPHIGVYAVSSGVNTPTYLVFRPFSSVADFDTWQREGARVAAQYSAEDRQLFDKVEKEVILSREIDSYAVSPRQSYVPSTWVAADPQFWKSNPVVAMNAREAKVTQAGKPKKP